ncbi:MAG TPA: hypothetical protein PKB03_06200, partial [Baekduia sp.]|nr:hypothetical protein [Baekduia sp.]
MRHRTGECLGGVDRLELESREVTCQRERLLALGGGVAVAGAEPVERRVEVGGRQVRVGQLGAAVAKHLLGLLCELEQGGRVELKRIVDHYAHRPALQSCELEPEREARDRAAGPDRAHHTLWLGQLAALDLGSQLERCLDVTDRPNRRRTAGGQVVRRGQAARVFGEQQWRHRHRARLVVREVQSRARLLESFQLRADVVVDRLVDQGQGDVHPVI